MLFCLYCPSSFGGGDLPGESVTVILNSYTKLRVRGVTLQSPVSRGPQKPSGVAVIIAACAITSHKPLLTQYITFYRLDFSFVIQPEVHIDNYGVN